MMSDLIEGDSILEADVKITDNAGVGRICRMMPGQQGICMLLLSLPKLSLLLQRKERSAEQGTKLFTAQNWSIWLVLKVICISMHAR